MCGSLCVFVDGWPKRRSYLRHLWSGVRVFRRPFFGAKTTHGIVSAKTCETEEKGEGRQLVWSETPKWSVRSETPKQGVGKLGWWPDELACLVPMWDFRWVLAIAIWTYIEKCPTSFSCVCSSDSMFVCFFLPPSVCCLVFCYTTCEMPTLPGGRRNNGVYTNVDE